MTRGLQRAGSPAVLSHVGSVPAGSQLWLLLSQWKLEPGSARVCSTWPGSQRGHGAGRDSLSASCLLGPWTALLGAAGLPQFTQGRPQSYRPARGTLGDSAGGPLSTQQGLGGRRQRKQMLVFLSSGLPGRPSLMGSWLGSQWEGCSPGDASSHTSSVAAHCGAPGDLPLAPAAVPSPSAAPVSCPSPNGPLVSPPPNICVGGPYAWDARLPRPSWWHCR